MNLGVKELSEKIKPIVAGIKRYKVMVFVAVLVGLYGFLAIRISQLNAAEPSDDAVTERLQATKRPKIDPSIVEKMENLQDQNIEVETLFKQARDNPFSEQ